MNGLSYKGMEEKFKEMLDSLICCDIFEADSDIIDLDIRPESDGGLHISMGEELFKHAGINYREGMGLLKNYPQLQYCLEGRRFGESLPWGEYEAYVVFTDL